MKQSEFDYFPNISKNILDWLNIGFSLFLPGPFLVSLPFSSPVPSQWLRKISGKPLQSNIT